MVEELKLRTGGRGPDACIDAVGMEAHVDPASLDTALASGLTGRSPSWLTALGDRAAVRSTEVSPP